MHEFSDKENDDEEAQLFINSRPPQKRKGNTYMFYYVDNQPIITIGPHWPLTLLLTLAIIFTTYYVGLLIQASSGMVICRLVQTISGLFLLCAFLYTALKNQGINIQKNGIQHLSENWCSICQLSRQTGTIHCKDCNICIIKFDHHCIWVGKCIGQGNAFGFQVFLLSFVVFFVLNYILLII